MMETEMRDRCVLCGKSKDDVKKLIVGLHGAVCDACIDLCGDILGWNPHSSTSSALRKGSGSSGEQFRLRHEVRDANHMLPRSGLVTMHSGNASGYDPESGLVFIKPSGMDYEAITAENLVAVELETGNVPDGQLRPSVDLPHHLYLYRNMPEVRSAIHTHSNYATAFAALERPIPLVLTAIADEFGGEIPCAPYVDNEGDNIGQAILKYRTQAPAILLGNHGVFAWGDSPRAALKAAIMVEDVAKTVHLALQLGTPVPIEPDEAAKWYDRYQNRYGQTS